jgi:hypothetical protein
LYGLGVQGFGVLFLLFIFFLHGLGVQNFGVLFLLFIFFLPSVALAGKDSVWSAEVLPSMFGAGNWWWQRWGGGSVGVVAALGWWPTCSLSVLWHGEA